MSIINLNNHSLLQISGPDAEKFLQGQLTCDVSQIDTTHSTLGAHCDPKGRMLSFFRLLQREQDYYLLMPSMVIEAALTALKKYAVFSKVKLTIVHPVCYGITEALNDMKLPTADNQVEHQGQITSIRIPGIQPRYFLLDFAATLNLEAAVSTYWHQLDIEAGIPRLYPQTIAEFLPHYLNLRELDAISFTKGCYTGQEIIARMQHRGKLKQQMVLRHFATDIELSPGAKCLTSENKNAGKIVDSINLGRQQLCLVLLHNDYLNHDAFVIDTDLITLIKE